ncbi:MAG: NAD-dependent DNA ligase LigA [Firmicutes bacterium]|nr:NAD-dependent DNA ligase LigA [Bacillota bacterium]
MEREKNISRMKELTARLDEAARAYYSESREIMSNFEYDALYDELAALEKETGTVLAGSPTVRVGYEVLSELPKERHPSRMLSLDKTKEVAVLQEWLGNHKGLLSWKMDGLTIVLTYENGSLAKAVTRGNGEIGEVVTPNARFFENLPLTIPYKGKLIVRGEAVIKYSDFEKINDGITDNDAKYKNPRNLCAGTVRQLDTSVTAKRHVNVFIFALVSAEEAQSTSDGQISMFSADEKGDALPGDSREAQFEALKKLGFEVVEYRAVGGSAELPEAVDYFSKAIESNDFPSDGLVLIYDDIEYGRSLGQTAKFPRDAIAFKWRDEIRETKLTEIEWSASRTGLINPVAIFEPVELEGTTVSRASVHNISIVKELKLGIGDTITVYKANMIIPQIAENLTKSDTLDIPKKCPVCDAPTEIKKDADTEVLICTNPDCPAKHVKRFEHFVSRDCMNIDGISEATAERLIAAGVLHEFADIFRLGEHKDIIVNLEGFKDKSFENMLEAAKKASHTTPARLLNALGIEGIGTANAKVIAKAAGNDWERLRSLTKEELLKISGVGDVLADNYVAFFSDVKNKAEVEHLTEVLTFEEQSADAGDNLLEGKTFVITGSLEGFTNRKELQELIESRGGKVAGSVSAKTSYLINNDNMSGSTKNKTAKSLGVPIITEAEFLEMLK